MLSQALNKRTGILPSLLCCRVGSLSGLQCQGLGTAGPRRTTWFMLRPRRAGPRPCPAAMPCRRGRGHGRTAVASTGREASKFSHAPALVRTRTRVQMQVCTSANMLVWIRMDLRLSRHTHANMDANRPVLVRACSPSQRQTCSYLHSSRLLPAQAHAYTLLRSQAQATELSHSTGLFLGALLRIVSVFQMLES